MPGRIRWITQSRDLVEAAVEEFLDVGSFEGDGLELSLVVVVEERQSFSSIWGTSAGTRSTTPSLSHRRRVGGNSLSTMTPTSGSLFLLRTSQRANGSSGVSGRSLKSSVIV